MRWRPITQLGKVDLDLEAEIALVREEFGERLALHDAHGLEHLEVTASGFDRHDADVVDGIDEGSRAAVHDRDFGTIDLDEDVVDTEAQERGHQVLDRRDGAALAVTDDGAEFGRGDGEVAGVDETVAAAGEPCPQERNAVIRFGGVKRRS